MEVLQEPDEGSKPRGPVIQALEDPDQGREVHGNTATIKLYHSDAKGKNGDSEIVSSVEIQLFEKAACA